MNISDSNGSDQTIRRLHIPVLFGIEAATRDELYGLGYAREQINVTDGLVTLMLPDEDEAKDAVATLNFWLRTAERVLYEVATFDASTFDELFEQAQLPTWERWLDFGYEILVKGYSRQSALFGVPAIQRTLKKAIVNRLSAVRGNRNGRVKEDKRAGQIQVRFAIVKDKVTLMIDTSGDGLHKRGYRPLRHDAPLRETLAAAILHYSLFYRNYEKGEGLYDPLCGSGTFLIEAAMLIKNEAPGLKRHFAAEHMTFFGVSRFDRAREYAKRQRVEPAKECLYGTDISGQAIRQAKDNALRAGVDSLIRFSRADIASRNMTLMREKTNKERFLVIANPPYGERLADPATAADLILKLGKLTGRQQGKTDARTRVSILSPHESFESLFGAPADKRRKLYNGMIKCTLFHYFR